MLSPLLTLPLWVLAGCDKEADSEVQSPPDYGLTDSAADTGEGEGYLPGPDPFEEGESRLAIAGMGYEGPYTEYLEIDDLTVFYYIYEDTHSLSEDWSDPLEGAVSYQIISKGAGWWGGGVHLEEGSLDLSPYQTLHLALKSEHESMEDAAVLVQYLDEKGASDVTLTLDDYGFVADGSWHAMAVPLEHLAEAGADLSQIVAPFILIGEGADVSGDSLWIDDVYLSSQASSSFVEVKEEDPKKDPDAETLSLLTNGGFEAYSAGADKVLRPDGWEVYPTDYSNFSVLLSGELLPDGKTPFAPYEGKAALQVYGPELGAESETAVYQTFTPVDDAWYSLQGQAWMPASDPLLESHTYALLQIKFFNSSWGMVDSLESEIISSESDADTWTALSASGELPSGVAYVQAAVEFWQCEGITKSCEGGSGRVVFDDLSFTQTTSP